MGDPRFIDGTGVVDCIGSAGDGYAGDAGSAAVVNVELEAGNVMVDSETTTGDKIVE